MKRRNIEEKIIKSNNKTKAMCNAVKSISGNLNKSKTNSFSIPGNLKEVCNRISDFSKTAAVNC